MPSTHSQGVTETVPELYLNAFEMLVNADIYSGISIQM